MSGKPPISVVITTFFDRPLYLNRAINSCKVQGIDVEVVVVGKGTSWQLEDVALHPGVDKVVKDTGSNLSEAVNLGHRAASGHFRFTLDDDDFIYPGALPKLLAAAVSESPPSSVYVYGDVQLRDRVHVTPEWVPGINSGVFRTSNGMIWHEMHWPTCYFRHPPQFPVFFADYDFTMQLERHGVRGKKVPVVTIEWIPRRGGITERSKPIADDIRRWINEGHGG